MNQNYIYILVLFLFYNGLKHKKYIFFLFFKHTKKGKKLLKTKKEKALQTIKNTLFSKKYKRTFTQLPHAEMSPELIKTIIDERKSDINNKLSGVRYMNNKHCTKLLEYVNNKYMFSNPLHPDVYPELLKMESEIIKMVGSLYELPEQGCGNLTTGGTESTICALKAYKKHKKKHLPFFTPEVLCTKTVHAAVNKACELLDLKMVYVELDENYVMDLEDLKSKISFKTCVIIGSAPCFAYGLMDPIKEISEIAKQYNVPFHVDACLGGFITPFNKELAFTFDLDITSISLDPHKFGYSPKGSSILLWKNKHMRHNQYFIVSDWTGGIYASVSLPGSRVGSQIATTWTSILYFGYHHYKFYSNKIIKTTLYLKNELENMTHIDVIGNPNVNVVAFYSKTYSVSQIIEYVSKDGWNLNVLQKPLCVHICITPHNMNNIENLINLLKNLVNEEVKEDCDNIASIYGIGAKIPDKSIIDNIVESYLDLTTNV